MLEESARNSNCFTINDGYLIGNTGKGGTMRKSINFKIKIIRHIVLPSEDCHEKFRYLRQESYIHKCCY